MLFVVMCNEIWREDITPIACTVRAILQHFVYHKLKVVVSRDGSTSDGGKYKNALWSHRGKGRRLENSSNCEHVDFSLHLGKEISYFFLFIVFYFCRIHGRKKSPRECRINEKNKMTERIKSQVAWLSKFKCLAMFFKNIHLLCVCFLSLGYWSILVIYSLLLSKVFA